MRFPQIKHAGLDNAPSLSIWKSDTGNIALEVREIGGHPFESVGFFVPSEHEGRLRKAVEAFNEAINDTGIEDRIREEERQQEIEDNSQFGVGA